MKSGILFVVDCLREDAFPEWFLKKHKGSFGRFETALNTPLSFNSLFLGRNLLSEYEFTEKSMYQLYLQKPSDAKCLWQKLKEKGVHTHFSSDLSLFARAWWKSQVEFMHVEEVSLLSSNIKAPQLDFDELEEPWFLLHHSFRAHCLQGQFAGQKERREKHHEYSKIIDKIFLEEVEKLLHRLNPDVYAVMGDHGEEFWENQAGELMYGHGTFKHPLAKSKNVRYTGLFVSEGIESPTNYRELHDVIRDWYRSEL